MRERSASRFLDGRTRENVETHLRTTSADSMRTRPWKESEYPSSLTSRPLASEARTPVADLKERSRKERRNQRDTPQISFSSSLSFLPFRSASSSFPPPLTTRVLGLEYSPVGSGSDVRVPHSSVEVLDRVVGGKGGEGSAGGGFRGRVGRSLLGLGSL